MLKKATMLVTAIAMTLTLLAAGHNYTAANAANTSQNGGILTIGGDGTYASLADAAAAAVSGSVLQLQQNIAETVTVAKNVTLDLNGHSINGTVSVANGNTLTVKDTATDDFAVAGGYGKIKTQGKVKAEDGYIAIQEGDYTSYHRLNLDICSVSLRPGVAGIYYTGNFGGDETVKSQIANYGTVLSVYKLPTATELTAGTYEGSHTAFGSESWVCGQLGKANGTLLSGIMKQSNTSDENASNASKKVYSVSYVQLKDGTVVFGDPVVVDLQTLVEIIDTKLASLNQKQLDSLQAMYGDYKQVMDAWEIPNLKADVTATKFYASNVTATAGDTVTVEVSVKNNPGILGMLLSVEYDESVLTLTGTANGNAVSALTYQAPSRLISGANYVWYGSRTGTVTDGAVLTLTFEVADDAPVGTYPIMLTCSNADTYDAQYNPIVAKVANGAVTVEGQTVITHTVTFKDYDGTVLKTETVEDGKAATDPAAPSRDGYEFVGWDKAFANVTSDLVVTAQYEQEATGTKFYASQETAAAGDTVTVTVSVKNNPGILGLLLAVEYDESVLTLTGTANGSAVSALTYLEPSRLESGANYLWYGSRTGTVTDGSVLTLTFKVADGAAAGTYPIELTYSSQDTYDGSYNPITATVADGAVTVSGQPEVVQHTVIFRDHDGRVLIRELVENGKPATAPAEPTRDGYVFTGWDKDFSNITANLVVTAQYEEEATEPKFYASKETASAGDTVTVTVSVKNNPGILGLLLAVEYDESVLTLTGTANGSAVSALTYLEPSRLESGANYLWYGSRTGTVTDGSVLTLTFKVADGAAAGTCPIVLSYSEQDTYDGSYEPVIATVADGAVIVG